MWNILYSALKGEFDRNEKKSRSSGLWFDSPVLEVKFITFPTKLHPTLRELVSILFTDYESKM